jgi:hypothetical protein
MSTTRDPITATQPLNEEERVRVIGQMEKMLANPLFSQSKRYAPFLRHGVQKTLDGQEDSLKERLLGVEVFGRAPDYDSNNDPVVRVTAGEVRKRIAQYYHDPAHEKELWIDLPTGTYVARFHHFAPDEANVDPSEPPIALSGAPGSPEAITVAPLAATLNPVRLPKKSIGAILIVFVVLASAASIWKFGARRASPIDRVFGNLVSGAAPIVITLGEPHPLDATGSELTARQHLRSVFVAYSDLQALIRIVKLLDSKHASYNVQTASGTSFADLRQAPTILLGGLDNPWTMRAQRNLRFQMDSDGNGVDWISDTHDPGAKKWLIDFNRPYSKVTSDFAIVAQFHDPETQQSTLIVAGLGENGTKAASEFLTDESQLRNAVGESLPKSGNFEVVLSTEVINGFTGAPKVLAKATW